MREDEQLSTRLRSHGSMAPAEINRLLTTFTYFTSPLFPCSVHSTVQNVTEVKSTRVLPNT